jgi:hypothetical protein
MMKNSRVLHNQSSVWELKRIEIAKPGGLDVETNRDRERP